MLPVVVIIIIGLGFPIICAIERPSDSIVDLYQKINTYGSLSKANSLLSHIQTKLKEANTVRMFSYAGLLNSKTETDLEKVPTNVVLLLVSNNRTSISIRMKRNAHERIALIELRCHLSNVYVRLGKPGHQRKYRLRRISLANSTVKSYDLTNLLKSHPGQVIDLQFDRRMTNQRLSIFYYSKSDHNLFSYSSVKHLKRRFRRTIPARSSRSTCARQEYEIDFNQFSFGKWILEPKRFNAYTCSGSCPNPLSAEYFPSNHAILLSLMRSQREHGQEPSCVPVQLKPLCLLYYDRDELVIKYHRDMIVQECGCR